jgi:rhodanese-related sulfurtransferase
MRQFFLLLALAVSACASTGTAPKNIDPGKATALIEKDVQLLDVRTKEEWDAGRLEGATRIDIGEEGFTGKAVARFDKSKPMLIYCLSGGRSADAAKLLAKAGFTEVYNLKGGIRAWKKEGKTVVK